MASEVKIKELGQDTPAKGTENDQRLLSEIRLGLQCPMCGRTYEVWVDLSRSLATSKEYYIPCCQFCKKHPAMNVIMTHNIAFMKVVPGLLAANNSGG